MRHCAATNLYRSAYTLTPPEPVCTLSCYVVGSACLELRNIPLALCVSQILTSLLAGKPQIRVEGTWWWLYSVPLCTGKTSVRAQWAHGQLSMTKTSPGHLFGVFSFFLSYQLLRQHLSGVTLFPQACFCLLVVPTQEHQHSRIRSFPTFIYPSPSTLLRDQPFWFFSFLNISKHIWIGKSFKTDVNSLLLFFRSICILKGQTLSCITSQTEGAFPLFLNLPSEWPCHITPLRSHSSWPQTHMVRVSVFWPLSV